MTTQLLPHQHPDTAVRPQRAATATGLPVVGRTTVRVRGDDVLSREGLTGLLHRCPELEVVLGAAPTADVVVVVADRVDPPAVRALREARGAGRHVVLVVGEVDAAGVTHAVASGAVGVMTRAGMTRVALARMLRTVAAGEGVVPGDLLPQLLRGPAPQRPPGPVVDLRTSHGPRLDERETEVLRLLSDGSDTREIAQRLSYSERTVKAVIQDITHRFGLRNRSHAVAFALRHGLI